MSFVAQGATLARKIITIFQPGMDLHFDRFSIITVETWPILRCYVISIKKKETDAYCTLAQFLIPGIVPIVPMFLELLSVLRYYHFLSLSPYLRLLLEQIYSSCTLFPALLATDDFVFFPFEREEGRKEGTRPLDPRRGKQPLSFLLFFFLALEKALARKMGTAGCYLRHLVLPPVLYSRSPTYPCKRPRIPHRHLTRVFNATGHGISAWTRPRARPESRFEPRLALLSYGGSA